MSVDSTTRRRPGADGASARSCSSIGRAPASAKTSTSSGSPAARAWAVRLISPMPGRNTSTSPDSSRTARRTAASVACSMRLTALAGHPPHLDRMHPPLALDHGRLGEHGRQRRDVGRRRHGQHPQVGPQRGAGVERERQAEIGRQVAFVDLVEDHQPDAGQLRSDWRATGQDALGDHLDARRRADPAFVAGLVADGLADRLTEQLGHTTGCGPRRQPAWLEHHDAAAVEPGLVEQCERDEGGLAGPGRRDEHGGSGRAEGATQVGDRLRDR